MPRQGPQTPNGAADIARRFGVTIKTLRLYEELGLIAPARTGSGWRQYGRGDIERLHMVLASAFSPEDHVRRGAAWGAIYQDLATLQRAGRAPDDPAATALADRAIALIDEQTGGDHAAWEATRKFWEAGVNDPALKGQLP